MAQRVKKGFHPKKRAGYPFNSPEKRTFRDEDNAHQAKCLGFEKRYRIRVPNNGRMPLKGGSSAAIVKFPEIRPIALPEVLFVRDPVGVRDARVIQKISVVMHDLRVGEKRQAIAAGYLAIPFRGQFGATGKV